MQKGKKRILALLLCGFMMLGNGISSLAEENISGNEAESALSEGSDAYKTADSDASNSNTGQMEGETDYLSEREAVTGENSQAEQKMVSEGDTVALDDTIIYENEDFSASIKIKGRASVASEQGKTKDDAAAEAKIEPEKVLAETSEDPSTEDLVMYVTLLDEEDPEYQAVDTYAQDGTADDSIINISVLDLEFYYQDLPLDVSECTVTAEITPGEELQEAADQMTGGDGTAPEAEIGIELTALQINDGQAQAVDSVLVEKDEEKAPVLAVTLDSSDPGIQLLAEETANPKFTVQYYAWLPRVQYGGNGQLTIINTDNGGNGSGGSLPQNGDNGVTSTMNLELTPAGEDGVYGVTTENELEEVYAAHAFEYVSAPNLTYFNRLYENGNYSLTEVWVLQDDKDESSTNQDDWTRYDAKKTHFTNRSDSAEEGTLDADSGLITGATLLINDNTVIRLVYDTTSSDYSNATSFYDYDITEDGKTTWDANGDKGINNPSNYTDWQQGEAKLAFGNANTGVSLQDDLWRGSQLNQYNRSGSGFQGCTFGLATGLDSEGHIQYADDVSVPNLFNDGPANGKISYDNGQYSLNFNRAGDTYTLASVEGAGESADNLQYFNHPTSGTTTYNNIWTNNFWPMDGKPGKDGLTGAFNNRGNYLGKDGNEMYPPSDDGVAHNNMFGMTYTVNFNMVEDYSGPLEYLFFGDDDMWVFLTDPNGNSRLVCDIGGVHSTVGEYVNLWDYIARTTDSDTGAQKVSTPGSYKLTFFYTERGLSGSSCYMQFTLPSVSSVTPEQNTSQLKVQKVVTGGTEEQNNTDEFNFTINLTDASGNHLLDDYAYTRYAADGTEIATDLITFDGGTFSLKNGEYIIIRYLPYGTKYTITENGTGDPNASLDGKYTVSGTVNTGGISASVPFTGVTASGQIQNGQNGEVIYTNRLNPKLPDTGGIGIYRYTCRGIALLALPLLYMVFSRKRRSVSGS